MNAITPVDSIDLKNLIDNKIIMFSCRNYFTAKIIVRALNMKLVRYTNFAVLFNRVHIMHCIKVLQMKDEMKEVLGVPNH